MHDNTSRPSSRRGHQDLLHVAVLLGVVPLLFFGALRLVEETKEIPTKPDPSLIEKANKKVGDVIERFVPPKPPPPGEAWVREIGPLEKRVAEWRSTQGVGTQQIDQLQLRLSALRQHIERYRDVLPEIGRGDHPLRSALLRVANEINQLSDFVPRPPVTIDWKPAYAAFDSEQRTQYAVKLTREVERQTAPLREPHRIELAAVTREMRELKDQAQGLRDKQSAIQRRVERDLKQQARIRAFEPVRAEALRLLAPFITPDYWRLGASPQSWTKVPEAQPVSWGAMERVGALQSTQQGLEALCVVAFKGGQRDLYLQPKGSFPVPDGFVPSKPFEIEAVKRAQKLLKEHAQRLIEEGLLLP